MKNNALLTVTEAARLLGITHQALSKGVKSGRFTPAQYKESGRPLFDPKVIRQEYESTREMAEAQDHARFLRVAKKGMLTNDVVDAKKILKMKYRKDTVQTKAMEFKLKVQKGEYIPKSDVKKMGVELGTLIMGFLDAWPSRLAPMLFAMAGQDEIDITHFLEGEVQVLIKAIRAQCGYEN